MSLKQKNWPEEGMERVIKSIKSLRPPLITPETDLHKLISKQLKKDGIIHVCEYTLGPRSRIDILTNVGVGIELKKGTPNSTKLLKQLMRYAEHKKIQALIVVTPWARHLQLPDEIKGKKVVIIALNKNWGLAL